MRKKFKILFCLLFFVLLYLLFLCKPSFGFSVSYTNNNNVTTSKKFYNLKYDSNLGLTTDENWYYILFTPQGTIDDNLISWVANNDLTLGKDAIYELVLFPKRRIKSDDRYTQPVSFAWNKFQTREASITDTYFDFLQLSVRLDSNDGASKAYDYLKRCRYLIYDGENWLPAANTDYMFQSLVSPGPSGINRNIWHFKNSPNTWDIALTNNWNTENPGVFGVVNFYNSTYDGGVYNFDKYDTFDFFSTKPFIGRKVVNTDKTYYARCNLILASNVNQNIPDIGWNNLFTSEDVPTGGESGGGGTTPEVNEDELTRNTIIEQSQAIQDKQQSTTDAVNNLNNNIMNPHTDTYNGSNLPQDNFQDGSTDLTGSFNLIKSMFDRGQEVLVIDLQLPNNKHYEFRLEKDMIRNMLQNNTFGNLFLTFWQAIATFIMLMPCITIIKNIVSNIKSFSITGSSVSTNEPVSYFINKFLG